MENNLDGIHTILVLEKNDIKSMIFYLEMYVEKDWYSNDLNSKRASENKNMMEFLLFQNDKKKKNQKQNFKNQLINYLKQKEIKNFEIKTIKLSKDMKWQIKKKKN